ncbi:GGDEF domain-containing protein [Scandinavium goeteborgense]|uniref:GGDEF domain-containing protein n=1 Tax=Scandinavium goeteborgense TaxID=1851514 RepID=UPI000F6665BE|nr:GGDEF domain-containing protein [Scandinavium goeteborgense]QKN81900.1 GGDEF domain-containing protein [Scandinavium goeteborgense]
MKTLLAINSPLIKKIATTSFLIVCLASVLSWELIKDAYDHYSQAQNNIEQFSDFYRVLDVSNKLAEERGYANQLIFASAANMAHAKAAFIRSQIETDKALTKVPQDILSSALLQSTLSQLIRGREEVDLYAAGPRTDPHEAKKAVDMMMESTEYFHNVLFVKTESFIKLEPTAFSAILQGQALGELRNSTGKLGSYFLYYLNTGKPLSESQLEKISRAWQKIETQWWLLGIPTSYSSDTHSFRTLMLQTRHNFQNKGAALIRHLQNQSENREPYSVSVSEFTVRYQNSLNTFNDMLQMYLFNVHQYYGKVKNQALAHFILTLIILFSIYALASVGILYIHFKVVKPLLKLNIRAKSMGEEDESSAPYQEVCEIKALQSSLDKLEEHMDENRQLSDELKKLTEIDALTGVLNRRGFELRGKQLLATVSEEMPVWLVLLDIDHFKRINDTWGHPAGDKVLAHLGETLNHAALPDWVVARIGGEEFAVMFRSDSQQDVLSHVRQLQMACRNMRVTTETGDVIQLTASFGVAKGAPADLTKTMYEADQALYQSKESGRDKITGIEEAQSH